MSDRAGGPAGAAAALWHEKLALGVAGVACGVYLLHSLPAILFPTGVLASALTLIAGVVLGLAGAAAALALAFYHLTQRSPGRNLGATPSSPLAPTGRSVRRKPAAGSGAAATVPGPTLPHAVAVRGELSGVVFTAPMSAWRRADTVGAWPPTCDPSQPFRAWEASVAQGTLVLRPIVPPPGAKPPSPGRAGADKQPAAADAAGTAAGTAAAAGAGAAPGPSTEAAVAGSHAPANGKVGIPLEGCTVELVDDGLKGRSEWIRRAPLLVRHPKWNLLDGEQAFFLWADDPAAKQQWLHALGWWCQDQERLQAIDAMYTAYCRAMADRSCLEYAEHAPQLGGTATGGMAGDEQDGGGGAAGFEAGGAAAGGGQQAGRRGGWKGWGANKVQTMRRKMTERRRGGGGAVGGGQEAADAGAVVPAAGGSAVTSPGKRGSLPPSAGASPAKPGLAAAGAAAGGVSGAAAAEMASLESFIDAKWMHSRKVQLPPAISEAVVRSRHGSRPTSHASSPKASLRPGSASSELLLGQPGAGSSYDSSVGGGSILGGSLPKEGFVGPSPRSSPSVPEGLVSAAGAAALPPGSPIGRPGRAAPAQRQQEAEQQQQGQGRPAGEAAGAGASSEPMSPTAGSAGWALPEGLPPLLSPDYAINAFVTRLAFDLLRRPDFQEYLRCRIQRQLSRLQRPDYITSLDVVGVDAGGAAPTLRNVRALPQPEASVLPQVLFDMRYQGAFTVTIELKVDIRDAAAWGRLDQALTRLAEGRSRSTSQQGLPPHAASAPALGAVGRSGSSLMEQEAAEAEALLRGDAGEEGAEDLLDLPSSPGASSASLAGPSEGQPAGKGGSRGMFGGIRQSAAKKLRQLAESTAAHISRIPLRLSLTFSVLEGTMCAWLPPPPGNRLFYSFVAPPHLELTARPELAGRVLKYSYHMARVSHWVEQRMRTALTKTMVFPGGGDILLAPLMALEHPNSADSLPSLGRYVQQQQQEQASAPTSPTVAEGHAEEEEEEQAEEAGEAAVSPGGAAAAAAGQPGAAASAAQAAAPAAATQAAAAGVQQQQAAAQPAAQQQAAAPALAAGAAAVLQQRMSSQQELCMEPSLSQLPTPLGPGQAELAATAAGAPSAAEAQLPSGSNGGAAPGDEEGHLISPRLGARARAASAGNGSTAAPAAAGSAVAAGMGGGEDQEEGEEDDEVAALGSPPPPPPDFQLWAPPPAGSEKHDGRSAADAWDAAMAVESRSSLDAPTPRFASQPWQAGGQQTARQQAARQQAQQGPHATTAAGPLAAGLGLQPPAQQQLQQQVEAGQPGRPGLQIKLSATRSLDPDFTRSAEHTGFGEAPLTALPDYSSVQRSLSARGDGAGSAAVTPPGSGRASREAVGAAISRSLATLRRQGSSLKPHQGAEAAEHAGQVQAEQQAAAGSALAGGSAQPGGSQAGGQGGSLPQRQLQGADPPQEGAAVQGDVRRQPSRGHGSFKEQAGKFLGRVNAAGKALASQVHDMQQQRAASRIARAPSTGHSGGGSSGAQPAAQRPSSGQPAGGSGAGSLSQRMRSQQEAL